VGELCCRDHLAEEAGHLHGFLDARPYMRARTQLAWTRRERTCAHRRGTRANFVAS
jgi:hypothetical protein